MSRPKDIAEGTYSLTYSYGTPVAGSSLPTDQISFSAAGTVSAVNAKTLAGTDANAVFFAMGTATLFVDADFGGVLPGTTVGSLTFPAIPALAGHEDLFRFTIDATSVGGLKTNIAILNPGDPETTILIRAENTYDIAMAYRAIAPHGTDPPFSVNYSIGVVPEPSVGSLLMLGLLCHLSATHRRGTVGRSSRQYRHTRCVVNNGFF